MDRGRGGGRGRATKKQRAGLPPSHHPYPESLHTPGPSFVSPDVSLLSKVPQSAPQRGNKSRPVNQTPHRASSPMSMPTTATTSAHHSFRAFAPKTDKPGRSNTFHSSFTFESPTNHGMAPEAPMGRKRAKTFETATTASFEGEDEAHSKGGHSLRKRTRIDYAQVLDDEIGLAAARNGAELPPKMTAAAPTVARPRKRKGAHSQDDTDDEADDVSSTTKRRRADKSPAAPRAASRRRNTGKKLPTGMSAYIDQPSDNDAVQDTILVGVSMDADEESEQSSYRESDSAPSSPEGTNPARRQDQQPETSKQRDPVAAINQPAMTAPENGTGLNLPAAEVNGQVNSNGIESAMDLSLDHVPETAPNSAQPRGPVQLEQSRQEQHHEEQHHNAPSFIELNGTHLKQQQQQQQHQTEKLGPVSLFPTPATKSLQPATENSVALSQLSESIAPTSTDNTALRQSFTAAESPVSEAIPQELMPVQKPKPQESPAVESAPGQFDGAVELESRSPREVDPPEAQSLSTATIASRPVLRAPKPVGPARLPRLERIYEAETPFASALNLEPYEDEDVILPGPYTEWVYAEEAPPTPTPMPTPTPTPMPMDNITSEVTWDVTRPLRRKDFDKLHRIESKRRKEQGLPPITFRDFNNECARLHQAAIKAQCRAQVTSTPQHQTAPGVIVSPSRKTLPDSETLEPQLPTAAPSPAAEDDGQLDAQFDGIDDQQEADDDQEPDENEAPIPNRQSKRAMDPIEVTKDYPRQYLFPKLRDPAEFAALLENPEELDTETLVNSTAAAVEALHSYQQEYQELKRIIDDEENSKRRQANDKTIANWENRQKDDEPLPWRRHYDEPIKGPPPFELRGARAPKPYVDDPVLEYQREQDRIMAQAYGFKHNNHVSLIGRQNPEEQRWEAPETRLRERKRTEKAAELAEDNVVEGKRTRRPRQIADQSKEASRAGTPALPAPPTRRPRKTATAAVTNGDVTESTDPAPIPESVTESPRKQRAAAAAARARQIADEESASSVPPQDSSQGDEDYNATQPAKVRKREAVDAPSSARTSEPVKPVAKSKRFSKAPTSAPMPPAPETIMPSFYGHPSAASAQPESRPSTASSEQSDRTAETTESTYSLRDKRKRNFVLENDPELEARPQRRKVPQKSLNNNPEPNVKPTATKKPRQPRQTPLSRPPPEPTPAPPVEQAPPQFPIAPQQAAPPPPPSGGLKAPTLIYSSPPVPQPIPVLAPAKPSGQPPGPFLHTFNSAPAFQHGIPPPPAAPPAIKKPITRIKLTNTTGLVKGRPIGKGSRGGGKPGGSTLNAEGKLPTLTELQAEAPEKSYSEMSKSEKMSYSMRRRWASGEMQGAVEKRRTTLANKKAEKATGRPGEDSAPGSANHSGASTPQPQPQMLPQPPQVQALPPVQHQIPAHQPPMGMMMGSGPLALPGGPPPPPAPHGPPVLVQPRTLQPPPAMQQPQPWGPPSIMPGQAGQMVFSFPPPPHQFHGHPGHPGHSGPMN
ncbi:hypothetical protein QC762_100550 [Podospora pseudocomata]|uniref:Uncharacterized protein n=1 Tax=Podospora pseudocomata TaxID=2093779 RepID=A0ABR0GR74_9PEZI|nr:hypothetical protein QC762_100550 [Podospora pseudocomata]